MILEEMHSRLDLTVVGVDVFGTTSLRALASQTLASDASLEAGLWDVVVAALNHVLDSEASLGATLFVET